MARIVEKPWGREIIWAETERYVGKILEISEGQALSLQYHQRKDETIYVLSGELALSYAPRADAPLVELRLGPGESFRVLPGTRHRLVASSACRVLEASTPELDDVVRLEDRYGRVP